MTSVSIISSIGAFATFAEIILSAIVGFALLANFKANLQQNLQGLMQRQININSFEKLNLWSLFGAFLFILPGFFGDMVAFLLQFGALTTWFSRNVLRIKEEETPPQFYKGKENEIIDVEVIDDYRLK